MTGPKELPLGAVETGKNGFRLSLAKLRRWPELGAMTAFVILFVFFSLISNRFFSVDSLANILTLTAELGIMTIGISLLMIAGEFDLSVSSVYALSGFLFVTFANSLEFSWSSPLALILALGVAALVGYINGIITLRAGIPSFITTLGTMMCLRGLLLGITGGSSVSYNADQIVPVVLAKQWGLGLRPSHIWFILLTIIFSIILNRTVFGNRVLAVGGKKEAARTMGVNTDRIKIGSFMITAVLAGLAGITAISRFQLANVTFGQGMELEAIASAVIGGTFMTGGYGTIIGAAFGACIMGMVRSGLVMAGAPSYWYEAFVGIILIVAATINLRLRNLELGR